MLKSFPPEQKNHLRQSPSVHSPLLTAHLHGWQSQNTPWGSKNRVKHLERMRMMIITNCNTTIIIINYTMVIITINYNIIIITDHNDKL